MPIPGWRGRAPEVSTGPGGGGRPPTPRRMRRTSERSTPWLVAAGAAFALAVFLAYLLIGAIQNRGGASGRGAFWLITILGVLAVAAAVATFLYTFRKRSRRFQERSRLTMMAWFKAHIWLGLLALGLVIAHVLTRPITTNLSTGKLALLALVVLVVSGVAWRIVYRIVPERVARGPRNLAVVDTEQRLEELQVRLDKLTAGRSPMFQSLVRARLQGQPPEALERQAATLPDHERATWVEASKLAYDRQGYLKREERQRRYARLLQRWKLLHVPLAAVFLGLVVVHVADVFGAGKALGGAVAQFPSSRSCAGCHTAVARQWRTSVMSHGVTSPIMVAQTALAVEENRREGHALGQLCVNCHGPIGATITGSDTLPFPGTTSSSDPTATGRRNLVLAEGVSCVVCHALDAVPGVGQGAEPFHPNRSGLSSLGTFQGPPQSNPDLIPVPDHQTTTDGFMRDAVSSSALCGACHVVQVDINHDGRVNRFADPATQPDLILQTTFEEWRDEYRSQQGCVACHAPAGTAKLVSSGPFGRSASERAVRDHSFPGVDYDLTPGHPGLSDAEFAAQAAAIRQLLRSAATVSVSAGVKDRDGGTFLAADVGVQNVAAGHELPTGFAFVRQMWLEVGAAVVGGPDAGRRVCLANVTFGGKAKALASPCASGHIDSPGQDLPYCDPIQLARDFSGFTSVDTSIRLAPGATQPEGRCDPWLASWQKILTDGPPPPRNRVRHEVAYQSLLPNIVATRHRVFDQTAMTPMGVPGSTGDARKRIPGAAFTPLKYDFKLEGLKVGDRVRVTATLHFRHLPPYFIQALSRFLPPGVTAAGLIGDLRVVDMATASRTAAINRV
jgi:mono/diheme cytochrome c family protein